MSPAVLICCFQDCRSALFLFPSFPLPISPLTLIYLFPRCFLSFLAASFSVCSFQLSYFLSSFLKVYVCDLSLLFPLNSTLCWYCNRSVLVPLMLLFWFDFSMILRDSIVLNPPVPDSDVRNFRFIIIDRLFPSDW